MIYLDNAATTLQKPDRVSRAIAHAVQTMASPGRGGYAAAAAAAKTAFACREEAAQLFGIQNPEQIVFTFNATHALNIAIKSIVKPGDTVLISGYEHNAVTRPLYSMDQVTVKVAQAPLFQPEELLRQFQEHMTPDVTAVICTHVSNVFGYILPVDEIAMLCAQRGKPLIVDASQSAGCIPVEPERWNAAFVAMPGHKGLYGPQGTGLLICAAPAVPLMEGGTGSESLRQHMPDFLPDRLEAGTHNIPGIAGLLEGLRFVRQRGVKEIQQKEQALIRFSANELGRISGVHVFAQPNTCSCQSNVLSFRLENMDCEDVAAVLASKGIAVRAGLHCAPCAHKSVGTIQTGTVRTSVSYFNSFRELSLFVRAVSAIRK